MNAYIDWVKPEMVTQQSILGAFETQTIRTIIAFKLFRIQTINTGTTATTPNDLIIIWTEIFRSTI